CRPSASSWTWPGTPAPRSDARKFSRRSPIASEATRRRKSSRPSSTGAGTPNSCGTTASPSRSRCAWHRPDGPRSIRTGVLLRPRHARREARGKDSEIHAVVVVVVRPHVARRLGNRDRPPCLRELYGLAPAATRCAAGRAQRDGRVNQVDVQDAHGGSRVEGRIRHGAGCRGGHAHRRVRWTGKNKRRSARGRGEGGSCRRQLLTRCRIAERMGEQDYGSRDAHRDYDGDRDDPHLEDVCERFPHDRAPARRPVPNGLQLGPQFVDARVSLVLVPVTVHVLTPLGSVTHCFGAPLRPLESARLSAPAGPGGPPSAKRPTRRARNKRYVYT